MIIAVRLQEWQKAGWLQKGTGTATVHYIDDTNTHLVNEADAFIDLTYTTATNYTGYTLPAIVLVSAVTVTTALLPANFVRINAWPGFLQRPVTELAAGSNTTQHQAIAVMEALAWDYLFAPDIPGMVTASVVSMIINEAFFALAEEVSSREEIDTAMKLGTNYPYGPFEWCRKIGAQQVVELLQALQTTDLRYQPAPLLLKEM
ncbi:3-hydroxybutyryl-CoA dehydrogenase [Filimonas lacunae]|uniref:3-hydroxybutyryl-CoA dehydrogenase n=1 Tax=Filimonas lacunae TaxID=477680 RepID=A0A1N7L521_9BACT|nr:3-hydroxyacyl-CoA dehydrogenase family protein [Filimonas lacunae]SIS68917.1 3-hydroxybutyryl-CoA dehydrogenase [Filimonas lacunae]